MNWTCIRKASVSWVDTIDSSNFFKAQIELERWKNSGQDTLELDKFTTELNKVVKVKEVEKENKSRVNQRQRIRNQLGLKRLGTFSYD